MHAPSVATANLERRTRSGRCRCGNFGTVTIAIPAGHPLNSTDTARDAVACVDCLPIIRAGGKPQTVAQLRKAIRQAGLDVVAVHGGTRWHLTDDGLGVLCSDAIPTGTVPGGIQDADDRRNLCHRCERELAARKEN